MPELRAVGASHFAACHFPVVDTVSEPKSLAPIAYSVEQKS
jgi:hypothetical protein